MVFFASIIVASDDPHLLSANSNTGMSPFSIALQNAGWQAGPHLINAFIFTASFSAINSSIYIASRTLFSLADLGRAPKFLLKTTSKGVPIYAAIISNLVGLLALINAAAGAGKVFEYIVAVSGSATFIAWGCIGVTHIRFRKAWKLQGHSVEDLPFRALWYPWGAYFISGLNLFLLIIQGYGTLLSPWQPVNFVFSYIIIVLFIILWVFWKFYKKTKVVNLAEVDLDYGQRAFLGQQDESENEKSWFDRTILFTTKCFRL